MAEQFGIGSEATALQDARAADDRLGRHQLAEDVGEHMRPGGGKKAQACQHIALLVGLDNIERVQPSKRSVSRLSRTLTSQPSRSLKTLALRRNILSRMSALSPG